MKKRRPYPFYRPILHQIADSFRRDISKFLYNLLVFFITLLIIILSLIVLLGMSYYGIF